MTDKIRTATEELQKMFQYFNKMYYDGKLNEPMITIQSDPKRKAYGWFTTYEAWKDTETKSSNYEINIVAETLSRPTEQIIATMLHEMVHLHCRVNNIKDTSRGGTYHNTKFKEEAQKHGLIVEYNNKIGWSISKMEDPKLAERFKRINICRTLPDKTTKAKKPSYKHVCPFCGNIARTTKVIKLICGDCWEDGDIQYMEIQEV